MKDCGNVCEGAMVAAVNCNEIMLDIPSHEKTSPAKNVCACSTKNDT